MAYFPTASYARERGQDNSLIAQEISILELRVLDAIANNALSTTANDTTTVTINSTVVTGSPMTMPGTVPGDGSNGEVFYNVWKGNTDSTLVTEQMSEVMTHFSSKKYTIVRRANTTTNTTFYWEISW